MPHKEEIPRNYKELLHSHFQYIQLSGWLGRLDYYLSYFIHAPFIGWLLRKNFTILCVTLMRYRHHNQYTHLFSLLFEILLDRSFQTEHSVRWWYLMRFGVAILQERQIQWLIRDPLLEDDLILLGTRGPKPLRGYDVAYSFVGYSLWLFERGDVQAAINMIKIAVDADKTWGYPEYLHGWYGLFTTGVDSVEHFIRAVHIDWSFLQRMKHDRTCQQHPEILREVHKRTLVASNR